MPSNSTPTRKKGKDWLDISKYSKKDRHLSYLSLKMLSQGELKVPFNTDLRLAARWSRSCLFAAADAYQTPKTRCVPAEVCQQGDQRKGNTIVKTGWGHSLNKMTWAFVQLTASAKAKLHLECSAWNLEKKRQNAYFATIVSCYIQLNRINGMMENTTQTLLMDRVEAGDKVIRWKASLWPLQLSRAYPESSIQFYTHPCMHSGSVCCQLTSCKALGWLFITHYLL